MSILIRPEGTTDTAAIHELTRLAFLGRPYAGGDEQDVIDRLRKVGALTLSLVAEQEGDIVGQITFSPAHNDDGSGPWFALGPVSVLPDQQGAGVGAALINTGLAEISRLGALGCILTGNPAYYTRFGFELAPEHVPHNEMPEFFMLKRLTDRAPSGRFEFHRAFYEAI